MLEFPVLGMLAVRDVDDKTGNAHDPPHLIQQGAVMILIVKPVKVWIAKLLLHHQIPPTQGLVKIRFRLGAIVGIADEFEHIHAKLDLDTPNFLHDIGMSPGKLHVPVLRIERKIDNPEGTLQNRLEEEPLS